MVLCYGNVGYIFCNVPSNFMLLVKYETFVFVYAYTLSFFRYRIIRMLQPMVDDIRY